jgi:hypothetical protein
MAIKIGHASIGELGAKNNVSGDSTGKEVCTRDWYNGGWHTVLRCKDEEKAEIMARECENACANPNVGYDQNQRNSLRKQAKAVNWDLSKVGKCECDCSSLVSVCAECADIEIPYVYENAPTTSSMVSAFKSTGEFEVLTELKYRTTDKYLRRGDILVKSGHTVMALQDGESAYERKVKVEVLVLKKGCKGEAVKTLQVILNAKGFNCGEADGSFGPKTDSSVRAFQKAKKLTVDGSVGAATWTELLIG